MRSGVCRVSKVGVNVRHDLLGRVIGLKVSAMYVMLMCM